MKKIAWITDSSCGLSKEFVKENNIYVLPLKVIVNDISYDEDVDLTTDEFYQKLEKHGEGAKTSQPSYGEFVELYEELKEKYDYGIAIHASSELTGTYRSSNSAANQTGFQVEVIDSKIGAYSLGEMIKRGISLEKLGKTYDEIVNYVKDLPQKAEMYLLPASFNQLKRSGRVSTTQAIFASLLNVQIILGFDEGKVVVQDRVRTKRRAKQRMFDLLGQAIEKYQIKEMSVMHAGVLENAFQWKEEIENFHKNLKVKIQSLVPVAGVHTGFGTMAIGWLRD